MILRMSRYGAKTSKPSRISRSAALAIFRSSRSAGPGQPRHRDQELPELVPVGRDAQLVEQGLYAGVEVAVTGAAGPDAPRLDGRSGRRLGGRLGGRLGRLLGRR